MANRKRGGARQNFQAERVRRRSNLTFRRRKNEMPGAREEAGK